MRHMRLPCDNNTTYMYTRSIRMPHDALRPLLYLADSLLIKRGTPVLIFFHMDSASDYGGSLGTWCELFLFRFREILFRFSETIFRFCEIISRESEIISRESEIISRESEIKIIHNYM